MKEWHAQESCVCYCGVGKSLQHRVINVKVRMANYFAFTWIQMQPELATVLYYTTNVCSNCIFMVSKCEIIQVTRC